MLLEESICPAVQSTNITPNYLTLQALVKYTNTDIKLNDSYFIKLQCECSAVHTSQAIFIKVILVK